jgi:hypothetical protein
MSKSEAVLKGSILYIDGKVWMDANNNPMIDVDPTEAAEIIAGLAGLANAPTGVRIKSSPRRSKQRSK